MDYISQLIAKLKICLKLIGEYRDTVQYKTQTEGDLLIEMEHRLNTLDFILEEIEKLEISLDSLRAENIHRDFWEEIKLWNKLKFFTESFYYHAFRCAKCTKDISDLKSFKTNKYRKIAIVRNILNRAPRSFFFLYSKWWKLRA